jgi:predicted dinucleotide-binding enzyme
MQDSANPRPDPNEKLVKVFDTEQEPEALVVQGLLQSAGIVSDLQAIDVSQDAFPGLGGVKLLVAEEDADAAKKIIESYRKSPPVDDETAELTG